jgi:uncharacterized protein involved in oxidation of intracellular sulfur
MKILLVLNDPPYGSERSYNGLRLAGSLAKRAQTEVRVFLIGDAVACAAAGQQTPNGFYNLERMMKACTNHSAEVGCCGSCLDARGIDEQKLVAGARHSSMEELSDWTLWADQVISF